MVGVKDLRVNLFFHDSELFFQVLRCLGFKGTVVIS